MKKFLTALFALLLLVGCDQTSHSTSQQTSPQSAQEAALGPKETYMQFRSMVKQSGYAEAFALMDDAARQEFRAVMTTALGAAGVPTDKLRDKSDLEIFTLTMSHQTPHEFQIRDENTAGESATLDCIVMQNGQTQPITIKMQRTGGRWLIHSTGVAFGP